MLDHWKMWRMIGSKRHTLKLKKIGQIALKFAKKQPYFCTCVRFALPYSCIFDMNEGGIL